MMISSDSGKESFVVCRNSQGSAVRATVLRMTRHTVTFEVYNPFSILQNSEVLSEFKIFVGERLAYNGKAVVSGIVNTGLLLICEVSLGESWLDVDVFSPFGLQKNIKSEFETFLKGWERLQGVVSDFKVMIADIQMFLTDLRQWLEQVEFGIQADPNQNHEQVEREILEDLEGVMLRRVQPLFDRFEEMTSGIQEPMRPIHRFYAKQQLHPLVLCAPFVHRTYQKPLGYAGDFEMVNMILNDPFQGSSLFAKVINYSFLQQAPAQAHRNRVKYLTNILFDEVERLKTSGKKIKILNLGCGPAQEIQNFLQAYDLSDLAHFTLIDFNDETLAYTEQKIKNACKQFKRQAEFRFVKKSVHQILKECGKSNEILMPEDYDLVYCAGLFDYLSDRVCQRLVEVFYQLVRPGGLVVVTNVDIQNPQKNMMEYVLEWHLIYRNSENLQYLVPKAVDKNFWSVKADETKVNIFLELRKNLSLVNV
ncbi:MAG: class I SAM-dependent methyltransferase [Verrucomicrobiae bacterium]|nr:class I SAM-dependent methyltransferase [Verrucomicrobiae bacterium]